MTTSTIGVSGISLYVPRFRVQLEDWCRWTGAPADKVRAVVGRSFRVCGRHESIYTMAANAVLRLIQTYDVDPAEIGFLGFGTESSTDNSAGAIILKGMVDQALAQLGRPKLARSCEVPEYKHACLGGVYALKGALRYLSCDGSSRKAIVVCGDIAEYERGSSGEQTQGAGAVAFLVERDPKLFTVDLSRCGTAADYRGVDFRKPFARHFMEGYAVATRRVHDFPVFNGKYSTACYIDEVVHALDDMFEKIGGSRTDFYRDAAAVLFHRPYHHMPIQAMAAALVWGMGRADSDSNELRRLCEEAGADFSIVLAEVRRSPNLFDIISESGPESDHAPETMRVVKHYRRSAEFSEFVGDKMALGTELAKDLGNLYTAALPAWIAAAFEDALGSGRELAGSAMLAIGYGSGDAAEACPIRVVPGWQVAARQIGFQRSLEDPIDLRREQYEALHDGSALEGLPYVPGSEFVVDRVGHENGPDYQDIGIEYYRYVS